jgi:aryl-alcohol dehydrogenase-like predicted oxidoreductase
MPRFMGEAFEANLKVLAAFEALAREAGCTPAQLCMAWLLAKDPIIVPIPGTTSPAHMVENAKAADITLSPEVMAKVDAIVNDKTVVGPRYNDVMQASVDTER